MLLIGLLAQMKALIVDSGIILNSKLKQKSFDNFTKLNLCLNLKLAFKCSLVALQAIEVIPSHTHPDTQRRKSAQQVDTVVFDHEMYQAMRLFINFFGNCFFIPLAISELVDNRQSRGYYFIYIFT